MRTTYIKTYSDVTLYCLVSIVTCLVLLSVNILTAVANLVAGHVGLSRSQGYREHRR